MQVVRDVPEYLYGRSSCSFMKLLLLVYDAHGNVILEKRNGQNEASRTSTNLDIVNIFDNGNISKLNETELDLQLTPQHCSS